MPSTARPVICGLTESNLNISVLCWSSVVLELFNSLRSALPSTLTILLVESTFLCTQAGNCWGIFFQGVVIKIPASRHGSLRNHCSEPVFELIARFSTTPIVCNAKAQKSAYRTSYVSPLSPSAKVIFWPVDKRISPFISFPSIPCPPCRYRRRKDGKRSFKLCWIIFFL